MVPPSHFSHLLIYLTSNKRRFFMFQPAQKKLSISISLFSLSIPLSLSLSLSLSLFLSAFLHHRCTINCKNWTTTNLMTDRRPLCPFHFLSNLFCNSNGVKCLFVRRPFCLLGLFSSFVMLRNRHTSLKDILQ